AVVAGAAGAAGAAAAGAADAAAARELTAVISRQTRKTALRANIQTSVVVEGIRAAACGARRTARGSSTALATVRAAAVRKAAPGKYTGAVGPENQANTCVMSGGPMIELRL